LKILAFLKINIISVKGAQVLTRVWYLGKEERTGGYLCGGPQEEL
jgi:hypothetical protein